MEKGNLSDQGKVRGNIFLEKSGKMKNWCHLMSDFRLKIDFRWGSAPDQTPLGELAALSQTP